MDVEEADGTVVVPEMKTLRWERWWLASVAVVVGMIAACLVVLVGIAPVLIAFGTGTAGLVVLGAVAAVVGVTVTTLMIRSQRRFLADVPLTTFGPDGITREHGGATMSAPWSAVREIKVVAAGSRLVVALHTDPVDRLAGTRRPDRRLARVNQRTVGAPVAFPAFMVPGGLDALAERVAAWTGGACRFEVGRPEERGRG